MYNWLKIGAFIVAGRFLKPRLKGLLVLIVFWLVINFLHGEYISYVELSGDTGFLISAALIKIGLYMIAFAVYVFTVERKILKRTAKEIETKQVQERPAGEDDGFDFLRQKKKLQSPAEQLLKKD
jgi:hypothetical protein